MTLRAPFFAACAALVLGLGLSACSTEVGPTDSPTLVGVDDSPDPDPVSANSAPGPDGSPVDIDAGTVESGEISYPIGTTLETTADLNLRSGASTAASILRVMPQGSQVVTVNVTTSKGGFLNVKHSGLEGWASAKYLKVVSGGGGSSSTVQDKAIDRAKTGVGFTYWWGHGKWQAGGATSSNKGTCSGSCPSCTHGGASNGADCSGFVAKVWQVPSSNTDVSVDSHPYSTVNFDASSSLWSTVSRSSLKKADALVYNSNGAGHIVLYESGDGWGSMWTYEARGCSYGIVHNLRTAGTAYKGIRRAGW